MSVNPSTQNAIQAILNGDTLTQPAIKKKILQVVGLQPARPRRLITASQAADILGVHKKTLERYAKRELLNPIRYSKRKIRYDAEEIEDFAVNGVEV